MAIYNVYQVMYCLVEDLLVNKMKTLKTKEDYVEWFELMNNDIKTYNYNQNMDIDSDPEHESKLFTIMVIVHKLMGNISHGKTKIVDSKTYIEIVDDSILINKYLVEMYKSKMKPLLGEPAEAIISFLEEYDDVIDYLNVTLWWK